MTKKKMSLVPFELKVLGSITLATLVGLTAVSVDREQHIMDLCIDQPKHCITMTDTELKELRSSGKFLSLDVCDGLYESGLVYVKSPSKFGPHGGYTHGCYDSWK